MLQKTGSIKSCLAWHASIALCYDRVSRFVQILPAISLVIPACLQIELNVPCGMLFLFRGTMTTLFFPLEYPPKTSSLLCLFNVMPICFNIQATSRLDRFLGILKAQWDCLKCFFFRVVFWKKKFYQLIHRDGSINLILTSLRNHVLNI